MAPNNGPSSTPEPTSLNADASTPVGHDGARVNVTEKRGWTGGAGLGATVLVGSIVILGLGIWGLIYGGGQLDAGNSSGALCMIGGVVATIASVIMMAMIRITSPGHTHVVQFFGRYLGTNRRTGLSVIPPLATSKKTSVRVRNFETNALKVNDLNGNPIMIGAIVVWQIADTAKATFAVEDVEEFIHSQAESALRHVATTHPYDGGTAHNPSLSGSTGLVSDEIAAEVAARVEVAGVEIIETRISSLSYAPEIAQAMLQRQQAAAIVDARETIVEGAVTMVESALEQLETKEIVDLDPERRAAMVSNLLVVLCSDNNATPTINAGSLYT